MASSLPPQLPAIPVVRVQGDLELVSDKTLTEAVVSAPHFVVVADAPGNSFGGVDAGCEAGVLPSVRDPPDNLKTGLDSN
ncbi:hypothetical protein Nepgr_009174 [Nepenthes gracilis]|uniref:Uncharacterized protein n=1 Tax=Nepenthes gracilis TaxID=150966 RepID=A0AAD3XJZ6_NEPGR|nr:hypothetical protein Nepgr_009174 [Nepenthes gracilis]